MEAEGAGGGAGCEEEESGGGEGGEGEVAAAEFLVELVADFEVSDALAGGAAEAVDEAGACGGEGFIEDIGAAEVDAHGILDAGAEFVPVVSAGGCDFGSVVFGDGFDGSLEAFDEEGFHLVAGAVSGEEAADGAECAEALVEDFGDPGGFGLEDFGDA